LKIRSGTVPKPIKLTEDGRACGWFGHQILAWQKDRIAAQTKQSA
jgi:predicted DNA-binding transcriptional regulator AlpA